MQLIENNALFTQISAEESVTANGNGGDTSGVANIPNSTNLLKEVLRYLQDNTRTNLLLSEQNKGFGYWL